ncbi:MAG: hypothetical protein FJY91_02940 [Candidatus Harrisonbacteria bacterium]|nr:hypothetical protein [Candidatus Harrisonbacteria bacterium]
MHSINWQAPEYEYYEKKAHWYWAVIGTSFLLLLYCYFSSNPLFAVFVVLSAVLIIYWGKKEPRMIDFELSEEHIRLNNKIYSLKLFDAYHLDFDHLVLRKKSHLLPYLKIRIHAQDKEDIEYALERKRMPTFEYNETVEDVFSHLIGF